MCRRATSCHIAPPIVSRAPTLPPPPRSSPTILRPRTPRHTKEYTCSVATFSRFQARRPYSQNLQGSRQAFPSLSLGVSIILCLWQQSPEWNPVLGYANHRGNVSGGPRQAKPYARHVVLPPSPATTDGRHWITTYASIFSTPCARPPVSCPWPPILPYLRQILNTSPAKPLPLTFDTFLGTNNEPFRY